MALTDSYVLPVARIPDIFSKIKDGQAPERLSIQLLKDWGFASSNDRAFLGLLKALGFLTSDGKPTQSYLDFLFRGLMFEAEAEPFRSAGIRIGIDVTDTEQSLLFEALAPFGIQRRNMALEMSRLYAVLFCFENEIRDLIREALIEKDGPNWQDKLPVKIRDNATSRREIALKDSWLEGEKSDLLGFVDFGQLAQIIIEKWDYFKDVVPSQHWLKQRMDELEKARNFIAHNRMLLPSEFQRLYMYVTDWNRVIGL